MEKGHEIAQEIGADKVPQRVFPERQGDGAEGEEERKPQAEVEERPVCVEGHLEQGDKEVDDNQGVEIPQVVAPASLEEENRAHHHLRRQEFPPAPA